MLASPCCATFTTRSSGMAHNFPATDVTRHCVASIDSPGRLALEERHPEKSARWPVRGCASIACICVGVVGGGAGGSSTKRTMSSIERRLLAGALEKRSLRKRFHQFGTQRLLRNCPNGDRRLGRQRVGHWGRRFAWRASEIATRPLQLCKEPAEHQGVSAATAAPRAR